MKINLKVFLGFLGASVFLILTLSVIFYNDLFNILTNQSLTEKKQEILLRKEAVGEALEELESELSYAGNFVNLHEYINAENPAKKEMELPKLTAEFVNFIANHHMYNQMTFINETGDEIIKAQINPENKAVELIPKNQLKNIKNTYYFAETIWLKAGKIFASLINVSAPNGASKNSIINYSIPLFDKSGQNKGMLNASVFSNLIYKEINEDPIAFDIKNEKIYIVDRDGYYIEHPDQSKEWGFLSKNNEKIQNDFSAEIEKIFNEPAGQFFDKKTNTLVTFQRIYPQNDIVEKIHVGSHEHSIEEAKLYTRINDSQNYWTLILATERSSVLNRVNILFYKTLSLLFLILLLFIVSMMWFFQIIVIEPLEKLRQGAQKIKRGNLDYQFDIGKRKDEIGELANEFNSMATVLKGYKETMEEQVAKRTADLEKFKLAVESAFDCIVITDPSGIILYANKATEKITGFTRREVMGKKIGAGELWGGLMSKEFYDNMWKKLHEDKKDFLGELKQKRKNGEQYSALISITPILNKTREIQFFVSIERDITNVTKEIQ